MPAGRQGQVEKHHKKSPPLKTVSGLKDKAYHFPDYIA